VFVRKQRVSVGILREQVPRPRQRNGCGLVPSEEKRHDLITNLLIGHTTAIVSILNVEKHGEDVSTVLPSPTARTNDSIDNGIKLLNRFAGL
jgi:hypothetical protein